ncbi:hypothetical protein ROHU_030293 [Labeo rohita]|uniref:Uncharacterized protein n=1 Tax=Labeo rohita TaxID=84645 RepID=A0A498LSD2_LABRO|nr:hypothetical protein ROHU_030293 [Labeo rohita]
MLLRLWQIVLSASTISDESLGPISGWMRLASSVVDPLLVSVRADATPEFLNDMVATPESRHDMAATSESCQDTATTMETSALTDTTLHI